MKITISDVAKKANVSVATVSRVMNGNYPVKESTKKVVLQAIKELNYIPNMQAKELTKQTSTTVGVISPSINNMFFPEVINGIQSKLNKSCYSLILNCSNNDMNHEIRCVNDLVSRNVAGFIILDPNTENIKSKFYNDISKQVPIVFINGYSPSANISSVSNDEAFGANIALNHLIENNHKDILFIKGEDSFSYDVKESIYIGKMKELGKFNPKRIINIGKGNSKNTVDITCEMLIPTLKNSNCTAAFCCNDLMAVGVLNACKKLGLNVPKDFSIIGFDNIDLSRYVEPKLTTIDQNMSMLGINAANLLLEKIENNNKFSKRIILNNSLVKRQTVDFMSSK